MKCDYCPDCGEIVAKLWHFLDTLGPRHFLVRGRFLDTELWQNYGKIMANRCLNLALVGRWAWGTRCPLWAWRAVLACAPTRAGALVLGGCPASVPWAARFVAGCGSTAMGRGHAGAVAPWGCTRAG